MNSPQGKNFLTWAVALCAFAASGVAHADFIVTPTVTSLRGLFRYSYSITNSPPTPGEDVVLVDVNVLPMDTTLTNLVAPLGFQATYDAGLGTVSFLPALNSPDLFAVGTTRSGFGFDSARPPANTSFAALTLTGNTLAGPTQGPLGEVPEPTTMTLLIVGISAVFAFYKIRQRS